VAEDQLTLALPSVQNFAKQSQTSFVHGERLVHDDAAWFDSLDPANGQPLTQVNEAGDEVVAKAVLSAQTAFESTWATMLPGERELALHRLADLIEANAAELAQYDALESGKPAAAVEAIDVALAVEEFRYYAGWPTKIHGTTLPVGTPESHVYTRREPLGVVAAVTPWNFPLCQAAMKLAPALAAGNSVVLKPSELTSMSSVRLAELAMEAGFPPGVLNVVTGTGPITGQALITHKLVQKISFTGSEAVGRHLAAEGGRLLKHVSLELGGKNPHILFADADIEKAATFAATTAFFYTGQVCFAGSRLMVERGALDEVMSILEHHARAIVMGPALDQQSTMGPLSSERQREKVERYISSVSGTGGEVAFGGSRPGGELEAGYFLEPTAVLEPADDDPVVAEEIFGPVVVVQPFDDMEELVTRANGGNFGLTAGVWTRDASRAHSVAARLKAGTVWVNTYGDFSAATPWGGFRASGLGRDGGAEGLDKYLQTKTVWMSLS
jgi:phenylacetaldehyde dehydrogenase